MHDLTQRQIQILKYIVEEYINTAEPVGSETLEKKHSVTASPATIRNEMVILEKTGYLKKPHTSAGRIPTPLAMKLYVKQLMKEEELPVTKEVMVKNKVWDFRERESQFLRQVTHALAEETGTLAITITNNGDVYAAGYANIFEMPEFFDIDITKNFLSVIDDYDLLHQLCEQMNWDDEVSIGFGDELANRLRGPYGFVFTRYATPMQTSGEIGIMGPTRLQYPRVIPIVRYFGNLIEESAKSW